MLTTKIGIYNHHIHGKGGADKHSLVVTDTLSKIYKVYLIINQATDLSILERYFDVDLSQVIPIVIPKYPSFIGNFGDRLPSRLGNFISHVFHFYKIRALDLDIFINNTMGSSLPSPTKLSIYMCMFPHAHNKAYEESDHPIKQVYSRFISWLERLSGWHSQKAIASYSVIASISQYTSEWIEKIWQLPSKLIYTVCEDMGADESKSKIILNVGRFSFSAKGISDKRQEIFVEVFKEMAELHNLGWELHLAGGLLDSDPASVELVESIVESARGYPIKFHFNLEFSKLKNLYHQSAIYWHGKGYGYFLETQPEKQEHFGITTIEAMSAGVVPITFNSGGQREIITERVDGLLWNDLNELKKKTTELANDPNLLEKFSEQSVVTSKKYGRSTFKLRVQELVTNLLQSSSVAS